MNPNTIVETACLIRDGKRTSSELVTSCFDTIEALEPQIRAWVCLDHDQALATAKDRDLELARGQSRGPLHGIPIGVKDIIDVRGFPTRAGSTLTSTEPVLKDARVVARLREAGAVILGKTVTTEYASFDPPPTRNPWNVLHTPGGSSSGSAAAVAAGMCLASVGTQTGGSIIRPASFCGVHGFKPSLNRLSLEGVIPLSQPLDHIGPMARCVADLKLMFDAMIDPAAAQGDNGIAYSAPPRIGLVESYFLEQADQDVVRVTREAVARLQAAGASVSIVGLPASFADVHAQHLILMARGAAEVHREQFAAHADKYGREIGSLIRKGQAVNQDTWVAALEHQQRFREAMSACFTGVDLLITPATATPAPPAETTGDPKFNAPWSYSGLPTVSIPCGLSNNGLPLSLQLIGTFGSDSRLLAAANWVDEQLGFESRPPVAR